MRQIRLWNVESHIVVAVIVLSIAATVVESGDVKALAILQSALPLREELLSESQERSQLKAIDVKEYPIDISLGARDFDSGVFKDFNHREHSRRHFPPRDLDNPLPLHLLVERFFINDWSPVHDKRNKFV